MKQIKRLIATILMVLAISLPASAQFRFGLKAGVAVNTLSFNTDLFQSSNRAGFTGGAIIEYNIPVVNLGIDASVLYVNRAVNVTGETEAGVIVSENKNRSYIDIPINLKWKINLPIVGRWISPFVTTGPDFSILLTKDSFTAENLQNFSSKSVDFAWNVGVGLELFKHIQIAANYGFPVGEQITGHINNHEALYSNNQCWTITATYLF